jgi:hypothetical protein
MKENVEVVVLPRKEDMMARLMGVDTNPWAAKHLYPLICLEHEREFATQAVELMVLLAINEATEGLDSEYTKHFVKSVVRDALTSRAGEFVAAITADIPVRVIS